MPILMKLTIQDWLITLAFFILIICILDIRKLKKTIAREIQQQILPQLILEMDTKFMCFFLKNEGFSIVQNIQLEDSEVTLDDSGYKVSYILQFENVGFLRSKEGTKLRFKVFDKDKNFLSEVTERIFGHLINLSLNIGMTCYDIEGHQIRFIFSKKGEKFYSERVQGKP